MCVLWSRYLVVQAAMHSSRMIYSHTLQTVCDVFDACDKDGSGRLSFEEFEDAMLRLDLGLRPTEVRAIFDATDRDHDGRLDYNECELHCLQLAPATKTD